MCDSVNVADISSCESHTCIERSQKHLTSCLDVLTVIVAGFKVFENKLCCLFGIILSLTGIWLAYVCLNRMGESVKTCCRSNLLGKSRCKLGVKYRKLRTETRVIDSVFFVCLCVWNNSRNGCFRACTCRGGNSEEGGKLTHYLQNASHLRDSLVRSYNSCASSLSAVHRRAAAESNHSLTAVWNEHFSCFLNVFDWGVRLNAVINNVADSCLVKLLKKTVEQIKAHKSLIGNNHNLADTLFFDNGRQFTDWTGSCKKLRFRPIKKVKHYFHYFLISTVVCNF